MNKCSNIVTHASKDVRVNFWAIKDLIFYLKDSTVDVCRIFKVFKSFSNLLKLFNFNFWNKKVCTMFLLYSVVIAENKIDCFEAKDILQQNYMPLSDGELPYTDCY